MAKFHISKNGKPSICRVKKGNCPLGENTKHFNDLDEANKYIEQNQKYSYQ